MPTLLGLAEYIYIKGILIGVLIAAPVGAVNIMCIRRTLVHGQLPGLATGLGAAIGDTILGAIAAFGLGYVISLLDAHKIMVSLTGAAVLVVVGVMTITRKPPALQVEPDSMSLLGDVTSAMALVMSNPITLLSFVPIFAGFGIARNETIGVQDWLLVTGILTGSAGWWFVLVSLVGLCRRRFSSNTLVWINRMTGAMILFCAVYLLVVAIRVYMGWL
jgi:threonine/homoserine/homoserine lactone efflux protein